MKAIILAAGRGSRMGKITSQSHKCLTKIHGLKLLDLQINAILQSGIKEIGLVTGFNKNLLRKKEISKYFHNKIWDKSNMAYSLYLADEWLSSQRCIVSYSDIFYSSSAIKSLKNANNQISITYDLNWFDLWSKRFEDPKSDAESFEINSNYEITDIGKKNINLSKTCGQYMGLIAFSPNGWDSYKAAWNVIRKQRGLDISITEILNEVIKQNKSKIIGIPYSDIWGEVDLVSDLKLYEKIYPKNSNVFNYIIDS